MSATFLLNKWIGLCFENRRVSHGSELICVNVRWRTLSRKNLVISWILLVILQISIFKKIFFLKKKVVSLSHLQLSSTYERWKKTYSFIFSSYNSLNSILFPAMVEHPSKPKPTSIVVWLMSTPTSFENSWIFDAL